MIARQDEQPRIRERASPVEAPRLRNAVRADALQGEAPKRERRPRPARISSRTGKVRLVLGHGQSTELVGIVYGLEHSISGPGYRARIFLDSYNRRIKVLEYKAQDYEAMILELRFLAEANRFDKIWVTAQAGDWEQFLKHGYVLEAILRYYDRGRDAYVVSKFRSQRRLQSKPMMKEILLIEQLMGRKEPSETKPLLPGYELDFARSGDVDAMLGLYRQVFKTYPSPLTYREYLLSILHRDSVFRVVRRNGVPVAAASAELNPAHLAAELTDCATHPDERGKGLMRHILGALEGDLRRQRYRCAFTLARAQSVGMNAAFHALGYEFNGRLVNNCDIFGDFEDMNVWVKDLRPQKRE